MNRPLYFAATFLWLLGLSLSSVFAQSSTSLVGSLFRTLHDDRIVDVVSDAALNLHQNRATIPCTYTKDGTTLHVSGISENKGKSATFKIIPQGLQGDDSDIYFAPNSTPPNIAAYPTTNGVYAFDGDTAVALLDNMFGIPSEAKARRTLPPETYLIVLQRDSTAIVGTTGSFGIIDWRSLGEKPQTKIPVTVKPVAGSAGMFLVIPKQLLKPGLYSMCSGDPAHDYQFGIDTPDDEAFWNEVITATPKNWQAHNHVGADQYMRGDIKDALTNFRAAVELNPANPESHNNLALALSYFNQYQAAIHQYELAVRIKDDNAIQTNLANAYFQVKRYDDAIRTYRHALSLNPRNASAHCNLGYALMQTGKSDEAISEFIITMEIDPDLPQGKTDLQQALKLRHINLDSPATSGTLGFDLQKALRLLGKSSAQ